MRVLISGASGLVGRALTRALLARGDKVRLLVRRDQRSADERSWHPDGSPLDPSILEGVDALVHLAGENVGAARWNDEHKRRVLESRVLGTRTLASALVAHSKPPKVFVSASAVGYYGDTGDARVDETGARGTGFLADVCDAWEAEAREAERGRTRVVRARLGVVLSSEGGALSAMLLPFKLGLGGRLGPGTQGFSFIGLRDTVRALLFAVDTPAIRGAINVTAPNPVSNLELTRGLARALHRPAFIPVPSFALRSVAGGEMAEQMFLGSAWVLPRRLEEAGFRFDQPTLDDVLRGEGVAR